MRCWANILKSDPEGRLPAQPFIDHDASATDQWPHRVCTGFALVAYKGCSGWLQCGQRVRRTRHYGDDKIAEHHLMIGPQ